jgi:chromosomal replication initiation ATPase DnaA
MTQDLESVMRGSLEGTFTTYPGNESLYSYDKRDPLQSYYSNIRTKLRRAAVKASRRAISAPLAELPKFDTTDAILTLRPLLGANTSGAQFKTGLTKMANLLQATAGVTGVGVTDLKGTSRLQHVCRSRQIFFWLARHYTSCSFPQIGNYVGKDHSTVVHGVKKVSASIGLYPEIKEIKKLLGVGGNLMVSG